MKILKQFIIIVLLFLLHFTALSQQQIVFNKLYNPNNTTSEGAAILTKGSGYVVQGAEWDANYHISLLFSELDSIGNQVKVVRFLNDTTYYGSGYGSMTHTEDGGYCFAGDIIYSIKKLYYMIRFNKDLDTLWTRTIEHDTNWQCITQVCETSDHGFVLVGEKDVNSTIANVLIVKTDGTGNKLWEKTIATGNQSRAWQVRETPDKGLLIEGYRYSAALGKGYPFILKTDSAGNFIWDNFPNCPIYNEGGSIAVTNEGDYLFAYGYGLSLGGNTTDYMNTKLNIIKYNSGGGVIWNRIYDTVTTNLSVGRIDILPNGEFYVLSHEVAFTMMSFQYDGILMKFNANGDSLWKQRYSYTDIDFSDNELYDGVTTNDGGFITCGYVLANPGIVQQIWVVKTDSNGYAPGMHFLGINEVSKENKGDVRVFPNPAKGYVIVDYKTNTNAKEILLIITDMQGRLQKKQFLKNNSTPNFVDVHNFINGMYNFTIFVDGKQKATSKIVIQN